MSEFPCSPQEPPFCGNVESDTCHQLESGACISETPVCQSCFAPLQTPCSAWRPSIVPFVEPGPNGKEMQQMLYRYITVAREALVQQLNLSVWKLDGARVLVTARSIDKITEAQEELRLSIIGSMQLRPLNVLLDFAVTK